LIFKQKSFAVDFEKRIYNKDELFLAPIEPVSFFVIPNAVKGSDKKDKGESGIKLQKN
jgi:hypothetical protein